MFVAFCAVCVAYDLLPDEEPVDTETWSDNGDLTWQKRHFLEPDEYRETMRDLKGDSDLEISKRQRPPSIYVENFNLRKRQRPTSKVFSHSEIMKRQRPPSEHAESELQKRRPSSMNLESEIQRPPSEKLDSARQKKLKGGTGPPFRYLTRRQRPLSIHLESKVIKRKRPPSENLDSPRQKRQKDDMFGPPFDLLAKRQRPPHENLDSPEQEDDIFDPPLDYITKRQRPPSSNLESEMVRRQRPPSENLDSPGQKRQQGRKPPFRYLESSLREPRTKRESPHHRDLESSEMVKGQTPPSANIESQLEKRQRPPSINLESQLQKRQRPPS